MGAQWERERGGGVEKRIGCVYDKLDTVEEVYHLWDSPYQHHITKELPLIAKNRS